jgi:hypothetical protein
MSRTVIVGDVHGCKHELELLLDRIGFCHGDRLVMVGDLVARGPEPAKTLDLLRAVNARAVRGNHEDRLLSWKRAAGKDTVPLSASHRATVRALRDRHWSYLASLPLWIDLPDHGLRVVHAGVAPGIPIEQQSPRTLMYVRGLDERGEPIEGRGQHLWGEKYEGSPHVVFGHNALDAPQIHPCATGLDTGAVYGRRLTAMVLRDGERPPPPAHRADVLVSVPSRRSYCER